MWAGVYWAAREESRFCIARRLVRFVADLGSQNELFGTWYLQGATQASACTQLEMDVEVVASNLEEIRGDRGDGKIPELGFSLGIWNGGSVSVLATMGSTSAYVNNSVVVLLGVNPGELGAPVWRSMLEMAVSAFDPDHGVVTTDEYLDRKGVVHPWEAGWFVYERGGRVEQHPFEC